MEERYLGSAPFPGMPASVAATIRPEMAEPSSPEDGTNLKSSLQIDMKLHMGDAVGNVSHLSLSLGLLARSQCSESRRTDEHQSRQPGYSTCIVRRVIKWSSRPSWLFTARSRKGLLIIDLEAPFNVPRYVPFIKTRSIVETIG